MKVKTKFAALSSISVVTTTVKGRKYQNYQADLGVFDGRRIRITRSTKAECQRAVESWFAQRAASGDAIVQLTPVQLAEAVMVFDLLRRSECEYRLMDIVSAHVRKMQERKPKVTVEEAYRQYFSKFAKNQVSQKDIVTKRVGRFVEHYAKKMVQDITAKDVSGWLDSHVDWSPTTWNGRMTYIRSFLNWCAKKSVGLITENPICDMEEKPVEKKPVEIVQPDDLRKMLAEAMSWKGAVREYVLMRMTLGYFCGVRTGEISRQKQKDICLDEDTIVVTEAKGAQSGNAARSFGIPETARKWLEIIDLDKAFSVKRSESGITLLMKRVADKAGVNLKTNAARHSFITYHIALYGDPRKTEGIAGTSDSMRNKHYDAHAMKTKGRDYFAITPESVTSGCGCGEAPAPAPSEPASAPASVC